MNGAAMEDRLAELEAQVVQLRIKQGQSEVKFDQLEPAIKSLATNVAELKSSIDKGRGAIWMIGSLGALAGAAGEWFGGHFFK